MAEITWGKLDFAFWLDDERVQTLPRKQRSILVDLMCLYGRQGWVAANATQCARKIGSASPEHVQIILDTFFEAFPEENDRLFCPEMRDNLEAKTKGFKRMSEAARAREAARKAEREKNDKSGTEQVLGQVVAQVVGQVLDQPLAQVVAQPLAPEASPARVIHAREGASEPASARNVPGGQSPEEKREKESADADRATAAAATADFSPQGHADYLRREVGALPKTLRESPEFAAFWPEWILHLIQIDTKNRRPTSARLRDHAGTCLEVFRASGVEAALDCLRFPIRIGKELPIVDRREARPAVAPAYQSTFPTRPSRAEPAREMTPAELAEQILADNSAYLPSGDGPPPLPKILRKKPPVTPEA